MSKWFGLGLLILFICFPKIASEGISLGLEKGLLVLMPAIFPYMVVSQVFIKTGGVRPILVLFKKENRLKNIIPVLLPSLFCGYPTGARLASLAYDNNEISKRELYGMYGFGNIPGFGFCVGYVGGVLYNSFTLGLQMYLSFLIASLLLWIFWMPGKNPKNQNFAFVKQETALPFSTALVEAVTESAIAMLSLICFVCFFSSIICFIKSFLKNTPLCWLLCAGLEITTGLSMIVAHFPLSSAMFFTAFSGLCVMFQSLSFDKRKAVNLLWLMAFRSIYGVVSVVVFYGIHFLVA